MTVHVGALTRAQPPFRAEHIGSLLRPAALLQQRERFARGEISQDDLTEAENTAISQAIALQERLGLRFATDGEFRRRSYHSFFYQQLGDVRIDTVAGADAKGVQDGGGRGAQPVALIDSRLRWTHPINVDDFNFMCCVRIRGLTGPSDLSSLVADSKTCAVAPSNIAVGVFWNLRGRAKDLCLPVKGKTSRRKSMWQSVADARLMPPVPREALSRDRMSGRQSSPGRRRCRLRRRPRRTRRRIGREF